MTPLLLTLLAQVAPPVLVSTPHDLFSYSQTRTRWGVSALTFEVRPGTRALKVQFAQRLDGMRVEVHGGDHAGHSSALQPERRYPGDELDLQWQASGVEKVTVVLHHHLRSTPVVTQWSSARWEPAPRGKR